jgi:serine/threonine protein kinase
MNTFRLLPLVGAAAGMAACAFSASAALTQWMSHSFELSFQQSAQSGLAPHPNVVKFYGMSLVSLSETPDPAGNVTNPLYADKGREATNPLYGDKARFSDRAVQFEVGDFASIAVTFSDVVHLHKEGIIHRDLAARSILVRTSQGDYLPAHNFVLNFGSDGPFDYRGGTKDIPIRWTAPESLRLFLNGDEASSDWLDIGPGASFETYSIPSPAGVSLLGLAAVVATRRRR